MIWLLFLLIPVGISLIVYRRCDQDGGYAVLWFYGTFALMALGAILRNLA